MERVKVFRIKACHEVEEAIEDKINLFLEKNYIDTEILSIDITCGKYLYVHNEHECYIVVIRYRKGL